MVGRNEVHCEILQKMRPGTQNNILKIDHCLLQECTEMHENLFGSMPRCTTDANFIPKQTKWYRGRISGDARGSAMYQKIARIPCGDREVNMTEYLDTWKTSLEEKAG